MDIFVARQPIFDRQQRIFGYELLYRSQREESYSADDGDAATLDVIRHSLLLIGSRHLTGGKKAFINFTRNLLLKEAALYLPPELAVVEILEDVKGDAEVLAACRKLKELGYLLALDDFVWQGPSANPLEELVHFIKVDFKKNNTTERQLIVARLQPRGVKLVAEKTETREEFQEALALGFSCFQGYYFSKPLIISRRDLKGYKLAYLRLLREMSRDSLDFLGLQKILKQDLSLTYKLLTYLNSAFFSLPSKVTSIHHALMLLGEREVRKWAVLVTLQSLGQDQPEELMRLSLVRARFCESLAPLVGLGSKKDELFLMGMLSLLDVFLGRPLAEVLEEISLNVPVREALLGTRNEYGLVFDLVVHYEKGMWEEMSALALVLGVDELKLPSLYTETIEWVEQGLSQ